MTGSWYCAEVNELLQVRADDGGLIVTDLGSPRPVRPTGPGTWTAWDGLPRLDQGDGAISWTNRLGRTRRYVRVHAAPPSGDLAGTYYSDEFDIHVLVSGTPERLAYQPGQRPSIALTYAGVVADQHVYYAGWDVLAFTVSGGQPTSLAIRCENATLSGFVRQIT